MTIITVCNEKGGVLKTTLAAHLAFWMANRAQKKVLVVDLDAQGNLSEFFLRRGGDDTRVIAEVGQLLQFGASRFALDCDGKHSISLLTAGETLMNLNNGIDLIDVVSALRDQLAQAHGYDYVIVDTPPGRSNTLIAGISVSDFVIIPSDFTHFAQQGVTAVAETIAMTRSNPAIQSTTRLLGVVPTNVDGRDKRQREEILRELRGRLKTSMVSKAIGTRPSTRQTMNRGLTVFELGKGLGEASKKEMALLMQTITNKLKKVA